MGADTLIPSLALVTLGAFLLVAIGAMAYFLRKRRNRQITSEALTGKD